MAIKKVVEKLWDKLKKVFFKTKETPEVIPFIKAQKQTKRVKARRRMNRIASKSRRINRKIANGK